jgi:hypothetical protein
MPIAFKRATLSLCAPALALGLSACGAGTASTSAFTGEAHAAAETISNLQSDLSGSDQKKVCTNDLASSVVTKLGGLSGCEAAIKRQLAEIDNLELAIETVKLGSGAEQGTAQAGVRSIDEGKTRLFTVALVKEAGKWKVASSAPVPVKKTTTATTTTTTTTATTTSATK